MFYTACKPFNIWKSDLEKKPNPDEYLIYKISGVAKCTALVLIGLLFICVKLWKAVLNTIGNTHFWMIQIFMFGLGLPKLTGVWETGRWFTKKQVLFRQLQNQNCTYPKLGNWLFCFHLFNIHWGAEIVLCRYRCLEFSFMLGVNYSCICMDVSCEHDHAIPFFLCLKSVLLTMFNIFQYIIPLFSS